MSGPEVRIRLTVDGAQQAGAQTDRVGTALQRVGGSARSAAQGAESLASALQRIAHYSVAGVGVSMLASHAKNAAGAMFNAAAAAERLATQLNFATGGNGARELAYVSALTHKLGLDLTSTARAYAGFASAARGTALEGSKTQDVFTAIAKAAAVMGLSTDETRGALLAVQQMMSKGVVSAEEFRGQLGERMPIALQAGARALGVTTAEFTRLLDTGQIVTVDFLPKFGAAIEQEVGEAAEQAATRLDAAVARMGNSFEQIKQQAGKSGVAPFLAEQADELDATLQAMRRSMERAGADGGGAVRQMAEAVSTFIARSFRLQDVTTLWSTQEEEVATLSRRLSEAQGELGELDTALRKSPGNTFLGQTRSDTQKLIDKLQEALYALRRVDESAAETARLARNATPDQSGAETARLAAAAARSATAGEYLKKYATDAERLSEALRKAREDFGGLVPEEVERRIRERFTKPSAEAAAAARELARANKEAAKAAKEHAEEQRKLSVIVENFGEDESSAETKRLQRYARDAEANLAGPLARMQAESDLIELQEKGITEHLGRWREAQGVKDREQRESHERIAADWQRTADQMGQSLSDALMQGGQSVAEYLRGLFRTLVLRPVIQAAMAPVTAMFAPSASANGGGGMLSNISSLGQFGQYAGAFGSALGAGATTLFNGGLGLGAAWSQVGQAASAYSAAGMGGTAAGLWGGAALGAGVGLMGGRMLGQGISGGYGLGGGSGNTAVNIGAALGALFGPLGSLAGGAIGGLVNRAFGRKLADLGIEGDIGAEGFTGSQYRFETGGWFRSDRTKRSALDAETESGLDAAVAALYTSTAAAADALGLNSAAVTGYTESLKLSTKGLSDDQVQAKLAEFMTRLGENLAQQVGLSAERLGTLATALSSVNNVLGLFDQRLLGVSVAGGEAAEQLAALLGGVDGLAGALALYAEQFGFAGDSAAYTLDMAAKALAEVGLAVPGTRAEFVRLVESQDLMTDAGRRAYAALLGVAGGLDGVYDAAEQAAAAAAEAAAEAERRSVEAQAKAAADAQAERARAAAAMYEAMEREHARIREQWFGLAADVREVVAKLRGDATGRGGAAGFAALQAQFATQIASAAAGSESAMKALPQLAEALSQLAEQNLSSGAELALFRARMAGRLESVAGARGFASGGLHTGGWRLVGERGPELEATGPSRIHTGEQLGRAMGTDRLAGELAALRRDLLAAQAQVVNYTRRAAQVLERASPDGDAFATRAAA